MQKKKKKKVKVNYYIQKEQNIDRSTLYKNIYNYSKFESNLLYTYQLPSVTSPKIKRIDIIQT